MFYLLINDQIRKYIDMIKDNTEFFGKGKVFTCIGVGNDVFVEIYFPEIRQRTVIGKVDNNRYSNSSYTDYYIEKSFTNRFPLFFFYQPQQRNDYPADKESQQGILYPQNTRRHNTYIKQLSII